MYRYLYLPSRTEGTEFFRISTNNNQQVVERLKVCSIDRAKLSDTVSPHGHFTSLHELLKPFTHCWEQIGSGTKKQIGEAINRFAIQNPKPEPAMAVAVA